MKSHIVYKKYQRGLFYTAAFLMLLFLFLQSGCAGKHNNKTNEIIVWHWMTDRQDAFNELAKRYKQGKGIDVKFELYAPSEVYSSKVIGAVQTNLLPDIFGVLGESRDFASFVKAGYITNLTSYMNAFNGKWKNSFFPKALASDEFLPGNQYGVKPGIYGVPIDVTNIEMLYNKNLFKKAGLSSDNPPQTWDKFIRAGKKLRKAGIHVLISGFGETWLLDCLANNFACNLMGKDKIIDTIKGKVPYTDPDWIKVFSLFDQLRRDGLIDSGAVTMINKVAEQDFANERAAIAFNGSWCVNVYYRMNPKLDYGVMLPPKVSDKFPRSIWGGAGSSFMVNPKSPMKDKAIEFLKWLTDVPQQVFLAEKTKNLPSNKFSFKKVSPILGQFIAHMDIVTHPSQLPVIELPVVTETLDKGLQSIIIGEKTPEQVAKEVQTVKEREIKRTRR